MAFDSKLALPLALGVSLVSVTAFVVYYIFKKDIDEENETKNKAVKRTKVSVLEINVPKKFVPALIGRSGSNIREIEKRSGASIRFKKLSDKDYDMCIVRGCVDVVQLAETLIQDFIKMQPDIVDDMIEVPNWACGRIIGTGGENISSISHRSGARVKIESGNSSDRATQRQVTFHGTLEQIKIAKELVENYVAQEKCRREVEQTKRSPRHVPAVPANEAPGDKHAKYKRTETSGASIEVFVSAVSSPSRFWVQFCGPQVAQLDELVAQMTEYYGDVATREKHQLEQVSVGQVVAAVFRHDGRWYRARVHDILPNEFDATKQVADVFYVDYGDSEYVAVNELCELRADLLRLRFQAMECFLAGVKPAGKEEDVVGVTANGQRWDRWDPRAIERFEELTQVARWKALVSKTCTYKKTAAVEGEKEKEIPGIMLYDVNDEGELDIGATLVAEGWAVPAPPPVVSTPSTPATPLTPFGDLGSSRVLGMLSPSSGRASSLPKDHKDVGQERDGENITESNETALMTSSKSHASGLEKENPKSVSNFNLSYPDLKPKYINGSSDDFLHNERDHSTETLVPQSGNHQKYSKDEFKANMNRIDSHHNNLEALARTQVDLHK